MKYIDIHSHVAFPVYDADREAVLARMREKEVGTMSVGVDLQSSTAAVALAERESDVWATIGLHPNNVSDEGFDEKAFGLLALNKKVVGVGECGLDYYRRDGTDAAEKERQYAQFEAQVSFAATHDLPLMIHCRPSKGTMDAYQDLLGILGHHRSAFGDRMRGNIHFFVGNTDVARDFLNLGFTFSFTGVVTFAREYDEVIRFVPPVAILTETDCPYVSPHPHRGKRNEPSFVPYIAAELARIRGEESEAFCSVLQGNACRVFAGMLLLPP